MIPAPRQAGPPALPQRPGPSATDSLRAAWADYTAALAAENAEWEQPATQEALGRGDGLMPAAYTAAAAQAELAWQRYLRLAREHIWLVDLFYKADR